MGGVGGASFKNDGWGDRRVLPPRFESHNLASCCWTTATIMPGFYYMAPSEGLEPTAFPVGTERSDPLSYEGIGRTKSISLCLMVPPEGLEPSSTG